MSEVSREEFDALRNSFASAVYQGPLYPEPRPITEDRERLSAVERDVSHLDERFGILERKVDDGFSSVRALFERQRQPFTAFAGWAAVILTLVGAVIYPQMKTDERLEAGLVKVIDLFYQHVKDGHPRRVEAKTEVNKEAIDTLQEQFRAHELTQGHPAMKERVNGIEYRLKALEEYRDNEIKTSLEK